MLLVDDFFNNRKEVFEREKEEAKQRFEASRKELAAFIAKASEQGIQNMHLCSAYTDAMRHARWLDSCNDRLLQLAILRVVINKAKGGSLNDSCQVS